MRHGRLLASVSSLLLGVEGVGLAAPAEAATWGPVVDLSSPDRGTFAPELAVDSKGHTVALWSVGEGSASRLVAAWRGRAGTWSTGRRVPHTRGVTEFKAAYDGAGELVLAWTAGRRVRAVRRTAGGSWGDPATLHRTGGGVRGTIPASLDLAVNRRGRAILAWTTLDDDRDATHARSRVQAAVGGAAGRWSRARPLSLPHRDAYGGEVAMSRAGRAAVVWDQTLGSRGQMMTASRVLGKGWTAPRALSRRLAHPSDPQLAALPSGELAVAWNVGGSSPGIRLRRWTPQRGWGRVSRVPDVKTDVWWLDAGIDASGRVTLAWSNQAKSVWAARQVSDGGWTRARVAPPGSVFYEVGVAVNRAGDSAIWWDGQDKARDSHPVQAAYRPRAGSWQPPTSLSNTHGDAGGLTVVLDQAGNATAAWAYARNVRAGSRIQSRYLAVK